MDRQWTKMTCHDVKHQLLWKTQNEYYLTKILLLGISEELVLHIMTRHFSSLSIYRAGNWSRKYWMIYVVDEVRVNVPLHIRIYSIDLNRAPRNDHVCPSSFRTRENLTVYKNGDKCSKSKRWQMLEIKTVTFVKIKPPISHSESITVGHSL